MKTLLANSCTHLSYFDFSEELVLFGTKKNVETDVVIDLIILLAQFYLYKCKLQKSVSALNAFLIGIKTKYSIAKYSAYILGYRT